MALREEDSKLMISLLKPKVAPAEPEGVPKSPGIIPALAGRCAHYERLRTDGDDIAARIIELTPADWAALELSLRSGLTRYGIEATDAADGLAIDRPAGPLLDKLALDALDDEHPQNAAVLLALKLALSATDQEQADALCSISYCALCLRRFEAADALARAALKLHSLQPRARCIVGLCALQSGDRKTAQNSLAVAARIARSNRDYAELLQAAQRLLLILHFEE